MKFWAQISSDYDKDATITKHEGMRRQFAGKDAPRGFQHVE